MIPPDLEKTPRLSELKRKYYIIEALYWRECGYRTMKQFCLAMARKERMNKGEFLANPSELPF